MEKSFLSRINEEIKNNADSEKVNDIELEALNYFGNRIKNSLNTMSANDVPYAIVALEYMNENLRKTFPLACGYADALKMSVDLEFTIIQVDKNALKEFL